MRLIDGKKLADEILGEIYERGQASGIWEEQLEIGAITYRDIEFANGYDHALDDIYRRINNSPTVNAIPIEWIEQFMNRFRLDMVTSDEYALLHFMLTEWEKENEIN